MFEIDNYGVGGERHTHHLPRAAHAVQAENRVFQVVVAKIFDSLAEADGLFHAPHAVGVEAQGVAGKRGRQRAVNFQLIVGRKHAGLQLVSGETETPLPFARLANHLVNGADLTRARARIRVAKENIGGETDAVAQAAAEDFRDRHAPVLAQDVETGEFEGGQHLRPVVVQRCRGIGDAKPHFLQARRIVSDEASLQRAEHGFGGFASAAHFAQADQPVIRLHFHDGPHEAAPVAAIGVAQRRFQRNRHRGGANVANLHGRYAYNFTASI